jgi:hypothetical protein
MSSKKRAPYVDPRKVGGRYFSSYWRQEYDVLAMSGTRLLNRANSEMVGRALHDAYDRVGSS